MSFTEELQKISNKARGLAGSSQGEEATKTSLVMPFFKLLGYNVFDADEFMPEFTADVGIKKGEKVDYAIALDGNPIILVEVKRCGDTLEKHDGQLFRYFATTSAKFGILTNGIVYKFYSDINEANKMDLTPFFELDLLGIKESDVPELEHFSKQSFDVERTYYRASELKHSNKIRKFFSEQLADPSDDFVRLMINCAYDGVKTAAVLERFRPIVRHTLNTLISELMNERITAALKKHSDNDAAKEKEAQANNEEADDLADSIANSIEVTQEELQAYYIVKAILGEKVDVSKITYKDTSSYFAVLYDGMVTKWICRFRFGDRKKTLTFTDKNGKEVRAEISDIHDIYQFKRKLAESASRFLG